ncbi:MAG: hypothetical protein EOO74_02055 [Myxococcales bacterium]|nr:MAG: hypothetical protein EOO74_02055 [Myxococcales bacterium]
MTGPAQALASGVRRAWLPLALAVFCFALAVPAVRDLERLFVGLGVLSLLIGLAITGFTAAEESRSS